VQTAQHNPAGEDERNETEKKQRSEADAKEERIEKEEAKNQRRTEKEKSDGPPRQ
jgi:hypothetical protein